MLELLVLFFAVELVEVVVVVLDSEYFLLDDLDFVFGLEFIFAFIEGWDEVFVDYWMELDGMNVD